MKTIASLIICFGLLACKTCKKAAEKTATVGDNELIGIVHVNENQCPIYIELTSELNPGKTLFQVCRQQGLITRRRHSGDAKNSHVIYKANMPVREGV